MITGAHAIIYSKDADADRAFLRDVLGFPSTDAGGGWLIFGLPPSEVAVHPAERNGEHELYLMCDDVEELVRSLRERRIECSPVHTERWGLLTQVSLPGGGRLGVYEPRHPRAPHAAGRGASPKKRGSAERKAAKRGARRSRRVRPRSA
jgi:catechol 2,3-dioxygenase-like lactoylglutathione lyase family enzyme